ncbi:hypothetical protein HQN88_08920 [Paenibacillus qinlingensis]|nr:hypothetical protein [Paenibacillus qinlingensis]
MRYTSDVQLLPTAGQQDQRDAKENKRQITGIHNQTTLACVASMTSSVINVLADLQAPPQVSNKGDLPDP